MRRVRLLVVDDAVVVRSLLSKLLVDDPQVEVVGVAASGRIALAILASQPVDLVLLDVEMPEMDGIETLSLIKSRHPSVAVMMFSSQTERGAQVTMEALSLGAVDYHAKPTSMGSLALVTQLLREELLPKIKAIAARRLRAEASEAGTATIVAPTPPALALPPVSRGPVDVVAIGTSTGGPSALSVLVPALPANFPLPILIVQHMPPIFTKLLAERLEAKSLVRVVEASQGEAVQPGRVYIAPGNYHMTLTQRGEGGPRIHLHQGAPENSCRPAVDVLFRSIAEIYQGRALAVVLTGMGQDGTIGSEAIRRAGGQVVAQDEASSVVWGMPRFVATSGYADKVLPLDKIAAEIIRRAAEGRSGCGRNLKAAEESDEHQYR